MRNEFPKGYTSLTECAELFGISTREQVSKDCKNHKEIECLRDEKTKRAYAVSIASYQEFLENNSKTKRGNLGNILLGERKKPAQFQNPKAIYPLLRRGFNHVIASDAEGNIYNLTTMTRYATDQNKTSSDGYISIKLLYKGKFKSYHAHQIVAMCQLRNRCGKRYVHHIDLIKTNNAVCNLIWVTIKEHKELHTLYDRGDMDTYYKRIAEIARDNDTPLDVYKVSDGNYTVGSGLDLYLTKNGNQAFLEEKAIQSKDILLAELKTENGESIPATNSLYYWLKTLKPNVRKRMLDYAVRLTKEDEEVAKMKGETE